MLDPTSDIPRPPSVQAEPLPERSSKGSADASGISGEVQGSTAIPVPLHSRDASQGLTPGSQNHEVNCLHQNNTKYIRFTSGNAGWRPRQPCLINAQLRGVLGTGINTLVPQGPTIIMPHCNDPAVYIE